MGKIQIIEAGTVPWTSARDHVTPEMAARFTSGELEAESFWHNAGSDTELELFEVRFAANTGIEQHAHTKDEVIYILEGSLLLGRKELKRGSSVFIGANTLYSFRTGSEGVHFLNFRPVAGAGYVSKDELLERRNASPPAGSAASTG